MPDHAQPKVGQSIGLIAEFSTPEEAAAAARRLRSFGFHDLDAYGPFFSEELTESIGFREHYIAPCVLAGGIAGTLFGFALQYYATVYQYPHNIGGRPVFSWPAFIPATFECTILFACLTGIAALLFLNRLPRLAHPVFSAKNFNRATTDHFFVSINAISAHFSFDQARELLLQGHPPISISILKQEDES